MELEYLGVQREGHGFVYELLYDGQGADGRAFVSGLIDVDRLRRDYDVKRSGQNTNRSALGRGAVGGQSGAGRTDTSPANPDATSVCGESVKKAASTHGSGAEHKDPSYPPLPLAAARR